jgi:hypothetical protein
MKREKEDKASETGKRHCVLIRVRQQGGMCGEGEWKILVELEVGKPPFRPVYIRYIVSFCVHAYKCRLPNTLDKCAFRYHAHKCCFPCNFYNGAYHDHDGRFLVPRSHDSDAFPSCAHKSWNRHKLYKMIALSPLFCTCHISALFVLKVSAWDLLSQYFSQGLEGSLYSMYPPVCAHSPSHSVALFGCVAAYIIEKMMSQAGTHQLQCKTCDHRVARALNSGDWFRPSSQL